MRFRSIQLKIAVLSGVCVLAATGALVGYGIIAAANSQSFVGDKVSSLIETKTRESLQTLATTQAGAIRSSLDNAFDAARNTARIFEVAAASDAAATPSGARREQFNAILLNLLKDNERFNGTYSAWEPDALDGKDSEFRNRADVGSDATGRFLPYWTRDAQGKIAVQPLVEYDSSALHPNGVMKGGWYIGPQNGGGESILDPLPYVVQGKNVYLATMSVPITIDGKFRGVAGADFDLSFVQKLAEQVKSSIYDGKAQVEIVSYKGLIVASSQDAGMIGRPFDEGNSGLTPYLATIQGGKAEVQASEDSFKAFAPIIIGRTTTPWSVMIDVPRSVAMAQATELDVALADRNGSDTLYQILVAAVVAVGGIAAMWVVARSISGPISAMTVSMRRLADGDTTTEIPGVGRVDEIGGMAAAVEVFRDNAVNNLRLEQEADAQRNMSDAERRRNAEAERVKAEAMAQATSGLARGLKQLASGDLAFRLADPFAAEFESLRSDFNSAVGQLAHTLASVANAARSIDSGSREISGGANDLAKRTEQQAASLEETAAALDEITANVSNSSKRADEARVIAMQANASAAQSGTVVANAVNAMQRIEQSSNQIANIIGVIDEIAFQTNLLALNAGVEAARAGDAGKGFAVVAQEVRELAQRSAQAAKEIKDLIRNSSAEVESGVKLVSETGEALKVIETYIVTVNQHMDSIATSAREQSLGLAEVNTAVNQMDQVTQQNAAMVEETNAASATLEAEAIRLRDLISEFQFDQNQTSQVAALRDTGRAMASPRAAAPARSYSGRVVSHGNAAVKQEGWSEF
ncbi:HAMP domain-containing protein [Agrobacterium sp. a22-2]|uniref:methyl-accepting chemotaxis protein n=1 Tax=Agrobacterium sp. a22-2 TaxID=2283840 RepID=UPI00144780F8|nr:methyl-accepting chemotaxis protein [Agrobacterium sp. a22-2]NKN36085.1 HAMP domain-containing protein [Agrobacterium sp. a22-2]